nr:hypothetical protein [Nonomuraea terrae]
MRMPIATQAAKATCVTTSVVRRGQRRVMMARGGPPTTTPAANAEISAPAEDNVIRRSSATAGRTPASRNSALPIENRLKDSR